MIDSENESSNSSHVKWIKLLKMECPNKKKKKTLESTNSFIMKNIQTRAHWIQCYTKFSFGIFKGSSRFIRINMKWYFICCLRNIHHNDYAFNFMFIWTPPPTTTASHDIIMMINNLLSSLTLFFFFLNLPLFLSKIHRLLQYNNLNWYRVCGNRLFCQTVRIHLIKSKWFSLLSFSMASQVSASQVIRDRNTFFSVTHKIT